MKKLKGNFKMENFKDLISILESKEELTCTVFADGPTSCSCRGPASYCPNLK